jgi:adenosylmethionine-8-amino-7-oxononanoate aminotransferase
VAEPVIGVGGYIPPPPGYWPLIRAICDHHGVLLVLDEVMTGFHRTGPRFAANHWNLEPDIMIVGKGINGCYVPCGGALVSRRITDVLSGAKLSGFTHTGHPLAMSTSNAAFDAFEQDGIEANVLRISAALMERLHRDFLPLRHVSAVEGLGLMIAIELTADKAARTALPDEALQEIVSAALRGGLVVRARQSRLALCPPLIVSEADAMLMLDVLYPIIRNLST